MKGYGGEDWELAWRAWLAGADLAHVPDAVAWHDGPDLKGREGEEAEQLARTKNAETTRLAPLLPHPLVRGRGWTHPCPDVVALVDAAGWTPGQVEVVVETLLDHGDVGVWVRGGETTGRPTRGCTRVCRGTTCCRGRARPSSCTSRSRCCGCRGTPGRTS
ncbi:glycosyltransferase family 2 protein [Ornithinimicrobium sp. W1665]|uniref:glycosyltransferase family 2 protein n=1 Tax=Ornithinimicrobium sp. W1665 TaxID=3416666 RepID=UPI003D6ABB44